jgi:hypothetical protein
MQRGFLEYRLLIDEAGVKRVGETHVSLDSVLVAGAMPEEIIQQYDVISLADVHALIGYCLENQPAIDSYLAAQRIRSEELRWEVETYHSPQGIQQRLRARRQHAR